jgi:hypothetical protein
MFKQLKRFQLHLVLALVVSMFGATSALATGGWGGHHDCESTNANHVLAYWHFAYCDESGAPGSEDCNTLEPIVYTDDCAGVSASTACNDIKDFYCVPGADTNMGAGWPAITGFSFVDNSNHAVRFSITLTPGVNEEAQLSRIRFYLREGGYNVEKYGIRVTVGGVEVYKQTGLWVPSSYSLQTFDFSSDPDFTVTTATTFDFEILGYKAASNSYLKIDSLKAYGGCCALPIAVEGETWTNIKDKYREE